MTEHESTILLSKKQFLELQVGTKGDRDFSSVSERYAKIIQKDGFMRSTKARPSHIPWPGRPWFNMCRVAPKILSEKATR